MQLPKLTRIRRDEGGIAIVEVLVSAIILLAVSVGVFTAMSATTQATATERHRAKANLFAEQELERTRSLRIADLATLDSTRRVLEDGTELASGTPCPTTGQTCYTITSKTQFLTETATTSTCTAGSNSRDYLQLTATVSWSDMGPLRPVTAATLVSPPSGSLVPNSGSLLVTVTDSQDNGIPGVSLSGSGAGSFSGTTGSTGCVLWRNLPAGTYTMIASGAATGMVDPVNGAPPAPQTVSIVDQGTNTVPLQYDRPGALTVSFKTLNYLGTLVDSTGDGISVKAPLMNQWKTFTGPNSPTMTTTQTLFPFASPTTYSAYAGTCASNYPDPSNNGSNPLAFANVTVPVAGTGTTPDNVIQLPSLRLTVRTGSAPGPTTQGSVVNSADVHVTDMACTPSQPTRILATNGSGELADSATGPTDPGLPYSANYRVCADANISGVQRMNFVRTTGTGSPIEQVGVTDPATPTAKVIYLTGPGATSGTGAQCSP
jgi:Tfp pilus assembly protein PilV